MIIRVDIVIVISNRSGWFDPDNKSCHLVQYQKCIVDLQLPTFDTEHLEGFILTSKDDLFLSSPRNTTKSQRWSFFGWICGSKIAQSLTLFQKRVNVGSTLWPISWMSDVDHKLKLIKLVCLVLVYRHLLLVDLYLTEYSFIQYKH